MIVPVVSEEEWAVRLLHVPNWSPESMPRSLSRGPVLVVAPHPDDETLGAGGLIAHLRSCGAEATIAAVTDGENAYEDCHGLGEIRAREQTAALAALGVQEKDILRFRIRDSDVSSHEETLAQLLTPLVKRSAHVIAPWRYDFHPDHEACGRVAEMLAQEHGVELTSYFFWTWHRGAIESLSELPLIRFPLKERLRNLRQKALACHRSQLSRERGDPILSELLLAPALRHFETFLSSQVDYEF
jgi:LmbE family N-acetylglucosaminyl deacetylase